MAFFVCFPCDGWRGVGGGEGEGSFFLCLQIFKELIRLA